MRLDKEDIDVLLSSICADSKFWTDEFWAPTQFILKGFNVTGLGSPSPALVTVDGSTAINANNTGSFSWFVGEGGASPLQAILTPGVRNFLELELTTEDGTPLTRAFWDPSAQGGLGAEFNQNVNTVTSLKMNIIVLTGGFSGSPDRIRLALVDTDGSNNVIGIKDKRDLFFRLGTPEDAEAIFSWGAQTEPELTLAMTGVSGTFVVGETVTINGVTAEVSTGGSGPNIGAILLSSDAITAGDTVTGGTSGATGTLATFSDAFSGADKSIDTLREIIQALQTEIKALKGTRFWFKTGIGSITGLNNFINSAIVPAPTASGAFVKWTGTNLTILDNDLTPLGTDVMARIRNWSKSSDFDLTRQDDGKEVVTFTPATKPTQGIYTIDQNTNLIAVNWNDTTSQIQTTWDANAGVAATISGSLQEDGGLVVTFNAAGAQVDLIQNANTLQDGAGAVSVSIAIKQGQASDNSLAIADGEVLFVELPASGNRVYNGAGSGSTNYQTVALGSFVPNDTNYWLAYREGGILIFRGIGEVQAGETSKIGDNVPQSLLDILGLASETTLPVYSSTIRGTQGESLVARLGGLTDTTGDSQEDRSAYLRSDETILWTGT